MEDLKLFLIFFVASVAANLLVNIVRDRRR
jgi:hypothetical protein